MQHQTTTLEPTTEPTARLFAVGYIGITQAKQTQHNPFYGLVEPSVVPQFHNKEQYALDFS